LNGIAYNTVKYIKGSGPKVYPSETPELGTYELESFPEIRTEDCDQISMELTDIAR
jgi:hypothetical protein